MRAEATNLNYFNQDLREVNDNNQAKDNDRLEDKNVQKPGKRSHSRQETSSNRTSLQGGSGQ